MILSALNIVNLFVISLTRQKLHRVIGTFTGFSIKQNRVFLD